jgi:hypothetical protein
MPATSIRDLIVKEDDLVVATHGRGFWILDNVTPLRQLPVAKRETALLKPQTALRIRWSLNPDTPLPPDEPAGENPPDGAIIDYYLSGDAPAPVTLEIKDATGKIVRRYASTDAPVLPDPKQLKVPNYWVRPPQPLSAKAGLHRFLWDLHYAPVPGVEPSYPMSAIFQNTAPQPTSAWCLPADYSVVLTVAGKSYTQPLTVKMDPRVKVSAADLAAQFELANQLSQIRPGLIPIDKKLSSLSDAVTKIREGATEKTLIEQLDAFAKKLREFAPANSRPGAPISLEVLTQLETVFARVEEVDAAPTPALTAAGAEISRRTKEVVQRWQAFVSQDVPAFNRDLKAAGLETIPDER